MGCGSSKQNRCRHCQNVYSPVRRSYSTHVHHPPQHNGDTYHVVALTSSTLGSINDEISNKSNQINHLGGDKITIDNEIQKGSNEFTSRLIDAKGWSTMITEKIPKIVPRTPIRTPPGEPETINTWELMKGLDDNTSPLRSPHHFRSFSFDVICNSNPIRSAKDSTRLQSMTNFDDPETISTFRKSLEELSPNNPFYLRPFELKKHQPTMDYQCSKEKVVLYFTSLRGIRKTYEDCSNVRVILKGLGLHIDERDVSMHSRFKEELREQLGDRFRGSLPRVFIGKNHIGGAEEIRKLHEEGELEKLLQDCAKVDDAGGACEGCGDIRFVPCETCSGSCKIYYENEEDEEEDELEGEEGEFGFQRCPDCNENGLIRCPVCCF